MACRLLRRRQTQVVAQWRSIVFIVEVFFIGVQGAAVSALRQMRSLIGGQEGRIGCPNVVTIRNGAAELLDGCSIFRSRHIQFM